MNTSLYVIFFTGLLTGGLTCLAVQGGLLAATIAQQEEERLKDQVKGGNARPIVSFLIAKIAAYTILGFLLGWLGSVVQLSITAKTVMQFAVIFFMLGTALSLLEVHPIFRYFIIQPPKFLTKLVRNKSKSRNTFAPVILGAFTVFIPCGTTQAMMALAIASGSPLFGVAILFAFILGTSPLFFVLGYFASKLGDALRQKFLKVAAVAIIILAFYSLDGALALAGSPVTVSSLWQSAYCSVSNSCLQAEITPNPPVASADSQDTPTASTPVINNPSSVPASSHALATSHNTAPVVQTSSAPVAVAPPSSPPQNPTIHFQNSGYTPTVLTIKAGTDVTLNLVNDGATDCIQAFTIPSLNIQKVVFPNTSGIVQFKAPNKPGQIAFMCSMGMYRGVMNIE
jgi:uncharacterized protein